MRLVCVYKSLPRSCVFQVRVGRAAGTAVSVMLQCHRALDVIPSKHLCQYLSFSGTDAAQVLSACMQNDMRPPGLSQNPPGGGSPTHVSSAPASSSSCSCQSQGSWHQDELKTKAPTAPLPPESCPQKALPSFASRKGVSAGLWGGGGGGVGSPLLCLSRFTRSHGPCREFSGVLRRPPGINQLSFP